MAVRTCAVGNHFGLLIAAALSLGTMTQAQEANAPPKVTIAAAYSEELIREATFVGRGEAAAKTDLVARVTGIITDILVKDGASVAEGDVIFQIEPDSYIADVAAKQAAVKRAQANLDLAEIELARKAELLRRETIAESELDIARANAAVATADLATAEASLTEAELNLGRIRKSLHLSTGGSAA